MENEREKVLMRFDLVRGRGAVFFRLIPQPYFFPRRITFADSYKIRDLYLRFGKNHFAEDMAAFDYAVAKGGEE